MTSNAILATGRGVGDVGEPSGAGGGPRCSDQRRSGIVLEDARDRADQKVARLRRSSTQNFQSARDKAQIGCYNAG